MAAERGAVAIGLHALEGVGVIRSRRNLVTIRDRERPEQLAGGSYGVPEAEYRRLIGPTERVPGLTDDP